MLQLDADALRQRLPWPALIDALRAMFASGCEVPLRQTLAIGDEGNALLMPAWRAGFFFGVKTALVFPRNRALGLPSLHASYQLFDANTGVPLALMDGSELTSRRTAAASALAAGFLARADAASLLVVGKGRVGSLLPGAMRCVRPGLQRIEVWTRSTPADLETLVRQADIVSCATPATRSLIRGEWLRPGTHLDLIGSFTPTMREADGACFARGRVFVDTDEALAKSGDLLGAIAEGCFDAAALQGTLAQLCRGERAGRTSADQITVFKSVGSALEDLAAAELAFAPADSADQGAPRPTTGLCIPTQQS